MPLSKRSHSKSDKGQSLVELALFFPILLLMLSGVIEFGFMLNTYLNLIDGPREGARYAAAQNPFIGSNFSQDNPYFYNDITTEVLRALDPVALDYNRDDIVISVFVINGTNITRYPISGYLSGENPADTTSGEWHKFGRGSNCTEGVDLDCHPSRFTNAQVLARVTQTNGGSLPPNIGVVLVEVYYSYHQTLKLPWLAFIGDPINVYTFTMMPVAAAVQQ
jgi:hypothetical protein